MRPQPVTSPQRCRRQLWVAPGCSRKGSANRLTLPSAIRDPNLLCPTLATLPVRSDWVGATHATAALSASAPHPAWSPVAAED